MPRKCVTNLPTAPPSGLKKCTISQYFITMNCTVCNQPTDSGICLNCQQQTQHVAVVLANKIRIWERTYTNITKCSFLYYYHVSGLVRGFEYAKDPESAESYTSGSVATGRASLSGQVKGCYNKKKCEDQKEHHGYKIGTWNVRTLNQAGKLENLKMEMQKNEVSVLGVREVRWKGQGEIRSDYTVYYCGGERAERSVAIVVHKSVVRSVVKKIDCNDRIIALKLKAEPVDILIMQVYMPTSEYENDEVEKVYDTTEEILQEDGRGDTNSIILGDWNSTVQMNHIRILLDRMD
ncbi:hypothetical protein B7P43_G12051 [Cryptotermes secundus]|uniref:Endonuclease/exonuclease/phosphatase domain-containing protein n=1 Tax=Cryptotermes secundus TaxID=105785 RepID=A0A2J7QYN4_9NEOP|nr:hypothetical protein B7P43_G12051 [Cryptotermes secundus]